MGPDQVWRKINALVCIGYLKLNSITLSRSHTWSQTCIALEFGLSCTIQLSSSELAGLRPAGKLVADLVSDLSQIGQSYLNMSRQLEPGHRPAANRCATRFELVCDLYNELVPDLLARASCLQVCDQVSDQVCDLDSIMEFGFYTCCNEHFDVSLTVPTVPIFSQLM